MKFAAIMNIIDPNIGGIMVMGDRGTGKSTTVRSLVGFTHFFILVWWFLSWKPTILLGWLASADRCCQGWSIHEQPHRSEFDVSWSARGVSQRVGLEALWKTGNVNWLFCMGFVHFKRLLFAIPSKREELVNVKVPINMVDLPLGATEDRVCGTIDIEKALTGIWTLKSNPPV